MKQRYVFTSAVSRQSDFTAIKGYCTRTLLMPAKQIMLFVLLPTIFLLSGSVAKAVNITITSNTNWSGITTGSGPGGAPSSIDDILISGNSTLTVDVANGVCRSITLGAAGQNNNGILSFDQNSQVTVSGIVAYATHGNRTNTITMTLGGKLICQGFTIPVGGHSFVAGTGTVELTATNTLPAGFITTFNNLIISGGTTTLSTNINATGTLSVNAVSTLDLGSFSFGAPTSLTLERGAASGSTISGTGLLTLGSNVNVNYIATGAGTATISCPVALGGTRIFTVADDGTTAADLEISGIISGTTFGITKAGPGTMLISGSNTYTGITTISSGTLTLGAAGDAVNTPLGTTGSGTSVTTGAALDLNGFTPGTTESLILNGDGLAGSGALTNSSSTTAIYSGAINLNSASSIGTTGDINITGSISGVSLTKVGTGTLILSGNNTFSGGITISAGTIQLGSADIIATQNVTFNGGAFSTGATTGFNETLGTIALNASSNISLGTGVHSLTFSASSGIVWGSGILTIYGWSGTITGGTAGRIFVGADASGLTADQLTKITFFGFDAGARILSTGEIIPLNVAPAQITISSPNPAVAAGNIVVNSTNNVIYRFDIAVTSNSAAISGLQITTGGTYSVTDLTNLKAWYSSDNTFSPLSDVLLSTKTASLQAVTQIFPNWTNQIINNGSTGYIFITADVTCAATAGSTINIGPVTLSDVSFLTGNKSGSTSAGGIQIFQNPTPENVTDVSASPAIAESALSWTNPANCFDEIMIVAKAGSAVTALPAGDGSAYTGQLALGSGTGFDGGYVVYKGTIPPETVTGLANNTTYFYTFFTRKGTSWSSGTTVSATSLEAFSGDYRSAASGNWASVTTWEQYNGTAWSASLSAPNSSSGNITIRAGHNVTVAASVIVDQVLVESGGQLTLNTGGTLTIHDGTGYDIAVKGTFVNINGTVAIGPGASLYFNSGSVYNHNRDGGAVPTATWDANSNCNINGMTATYPTGMNQTFGNVSFNVNFASAIEMLSSLICQGNLSLANSGGGTLFLSNSNTSRTIFVGGNFTLTAGTFTQSGSTGSGNVNVQGSFSKSGNGTYTILSNRTSSSLTVNGNVTITAGTFNLAASRATGTLNVAGNFSHTGGTITETSNGNGSGLIIFDGINTQQVYTSGGTITNKINFAVNSGAYLQMAASGTVSGGGSFTLSPDATLGVTSPAGITIAGATGNIQVTGTRTFDTGAHYIYNGTSPQNTGNGLPATVNSLTFSNTAGAVTFNAARTITNNFSITSGSVANLGTFTHTAGILTLGGISQAGGSYGSTLSPATNKNDTYFAAATGIVNVLLGCVSGTWVGGTSADWNNPLNWCRGALPLPGTDVSISSSALNMPVISSAPPSTPAVCNNLNISLGATLTINAGQALTVSSNLSNSGTLNLKSDASGIASLIVVGTSPVTGTNNIELYLTGGGAPLTYKWHYISSPVAGVSISAFNGNTLDLARYDERLVQTSQNDGWVAADGYIYKDGSSGTGFSSLTLGRGYAYYFGADQRYTLTGTINTGAVTNLTLSYNAGGTGNVDIIGNNLIGNPFTCTLDWDVVAAYNGLPKAGISSAIYSTKDYNMFPTYIPGGPNPGTDGGTNTIPPMQAFFVDALATGQSLTLPVEAKTHSGAARFKGSAVAEAVPLVRLVIENSDDSRDALVWFNEKATHSFDGSFDAYKLNKSLGPVNLWTKSGDIDLAINGIPFPETSVEIPVGVHVEAAGKYNLYANELVSMDNYNVSLKDKTTNVTVDLKSGTKISFSTAEGDSEDRFILTVTHIVTGTENVTLPENLFNIYAFNGMLNIELLSDNWSGKKCDIKLTDLTGRLCKVVRNAELWKNSLLQIPVQEANGVYIVEIKSGNKRYTGKVMIR